MGRALQLCCVAAAILAVHSTAAADTFKVVAKIRKGDPMTFTQLASPDELNTSDPTWPTYTTEPDTYWVISVETAKPGGSLYNYCVIAGPDPSANGARGEFVIRNSTKYPSHQEVAITKGVAYYSSIGDAQYPYGGTQGGSSVGEGTIFMAYGRTGAITSDVFVLFDDDDGIHIGSLRIWPKGNDDDNVAKCLSLANHYLVVADAPTDLSDHVESKVTKDGGDESIRKAILGTFTLVDFALKQDATLRDIGLDRPLPF